jgi:hypothetical protein
MPTLAEVASRFEALESTETLRNTPLEHWYVRLAGWKRELINTIEALPEATRIDDETALKNMGLVEYELKKAVRPGIPASVKIPAAAMRDFLIGYSIKIINGGIQDPQTAAAVIQAGIMTPEEVTADFEHRWYACQAIVKLRDLGALNPLYELPRQRGVGEFVSATLLVVLGSIVIVLLGMAAIAAVAFIIVDGQRVTAANKLLQENIDKLCYDEQGRPIPKLREACIKAAADAHKRLVPEKPTPPPQELLDKAIKYGAYGLGAYLLIMVLPTLISQFKKTRHAVRTPASHQLPAGSG